MSYRIVTSLCFVFVLSLYSGNLFATEGQTYSEYETSVNTFCKDSNKPWGTNNSIVPEINYPELTDTAVNATIGKWRDSMPAWMIGSEKIRLREDLDPVKIGEYSGFKTLEVSRIGYRSQMNAIFACGIISSRIDTIKNLQNIISTKIGIKNSEILEKLKKEGLQLEQTSNMIKCNIPTEKDQIMTSMINTATIRYCQYRYYLGYLDSNITVNIRNVQDIEKKIGQGNGTRIPTTTEEWGKLIPRYSQDINKEIIRADATLPKAIRGFFEMDQTYGAHIILMFIYDDYIRLRKALASYMNLSSQLYQKAYNAQSTNKS